MSASNRRKGHRWERDVISYIGGVTGLDLASRREAAGTYSSGSDIVTVTKRSIEGEIQLWDPTVAGWSLETKNEKKFNLSGWMKQASDQSNGDPFAVIAKRRQKSTDEGYVVMPLSIFVDELTRGTR